MDIQAHTSNLITPTYLLISRPFLDKSRLSQLTVVHSYHSHSVSKTRSYRAQSLRTASLKTHPLVQLFTSQFKNHGTSMDISASTTRFAKKRKDWEKQSEAHYFLYPEMADENSHNDDDGRVASLHVRSDSSDSDVSNLAVDDSVAHQMSALITDASSTSSASVTSMESHDASAHAPLSDLCSHLPSKKKRVVILNSNHTGLLAAIYFLRRPGHSVTILSPNIDVGLLSLSELALNRGTQIGLSDSGLAAIQAVPGLWEQYIRPYEMEAMDFVPAAACGGAARMTIDENYLCWALSKYLADHFTNKAHVNYFLSHMDKETTAQEDDDDDDDDDDNDFTAYYSVVTTQAHPQNDKRAVTTTKRRRRSSRKKSPNDVNGDRNDSKRAVVFRHWYEDEDDAAKTVEYDLLMR